MLGFKRVSLFAVFLVSVFSFQFKNVVHAAPTVPTTPENCAQLPQMEANMRRMLGSSGAEHIAGFLKQMEIQCANLVKSPKQAMPGMDPHMPGMDPHMPGMDPHMPGM